MELHDTILVDFSRMIDHGGYSSMPYYSNFNMGVLHSSDTVWTMVWFTRFAREAHVAVYQGWPRGEGALDRTMEFGDGISWFFIHCHRHGYEPKPSSPPTVSLS
jgi:hypothetical protein